MYKNLWKTRQFSLVPKCILTPHLMTVVKQVSYLQYFTGQWLKKKYHLQEVSNGREYGTRNIYYFLKFVTLVLEIYFEQNSVHKLENTPRSRLWKGIHSLFFILCKFYTQITGCRLHIITADFKTIYKCNNTLTRKTISLFVVLNGIQHIANVSNTTTRKLAVVGTITTRS